MTLVGMVVGLLVGALAAWFATKSGQGKAVEAALATERAQSAAELGQLRERARGAEESRREDQAHAQTLTSRLSEVEAEADRLREAVATLNERSEQVGPLQVKVQALEGQRESAEAELLRVSGELATAAQRAKSSEELLVSTKEELDRLKQAAAKLQQELTDALSEKAALVEQVTRIEPLEQALAAARQQGTDLNQELATVKEQAAETSAGLSASLQAEREATGLLRQELAQEKSTRASIEHERNTLNTQLAELQTTLESERRASVEKLKVLEDAKESLSQQFQLLANRIFDEKSQKFAEQNKTALGTLLDPLRTQLSEFKGKVEEVYVQEGKDRHALAKQVEQLLILNQTLSQDAQNLTDALKGNAQVQGAWGEWVLEELLSSSGLMKDEHYFLQDSQTREDGTRGRPDALITLPGERKLVVDSKVSLVAYEQYASAKSDEDRAAALKGHLDSMRRHIGGLSDREYQKLYPTLDFVMMFVPLEPAFMLMAANDKQLFSQAWEKNVLLVSPSTLLFVLRTVAYLWNKEEQNRNARKISERGALLYDKFCDFVKDLEAVGQRLDHAQTAFGEAKKKLHEGSGNLVGQAQKLAALGVKGSKKLSPAMLKLADLEDGLEELAQRAAGNTVALGKDGAIEGDAATDG